MTNEEKMLKLYEAGLEPDMWANSLNGETVLMKQPRWSDPQPYFTESRLWELLPKTIIDKNRDTFHLHVREDFEGPTVYYTGFGTEPEAQTGATLLEALLDAVYHVPDTRKTIRKNKYK